MIQFSDDIRYRIVDKAAFIVNIRTNAIQKLNADAFVYLKQRIDEGLSKADVNDKNVAFNQFVIELLSSNVVRDENDNR